MKPTLLRHTSPSVWKSPCNQPSTMDNFPPIQPPPIPPRSELRRNRRPVMDHSRSESFQAGEGRSAPTAYPDRHPFPGHPRDPGYLEGLGVWQPGVEQEKSMPALITPRNASRLNNTHILNAAVSPTGSLESRVYLAVYSPAFP